MANAIQMVSETEYTLINKGHAMTLKKEDGSWVMYTMNAAVKAYNRGFPIPKYFASLQAVEKNYKSWAGISQLATN